ncbi:MULTISPECIES: penicillin-binding protein 1C [unclassified Arsukibacterium]|uniref:penicillin-binding protein 1C n=1 Tax=unclassified Arsukibacterium TaxID=2635278 RepID=UPI000C9096A2|nr:MULTISPECIES: penicillin-binding protein 1C [unclassified Arsukibacterium]MAA95484.1 penicillin-binding protein 1C [Rheinheimera sp.]HAW94383.1 penicillin-binding protein 1C [Candidatus Azambacteria bacterium]|tara:strand:+ start:14947 stop:17424 length:2478 start_codon:yes stop_codon:yes gene_type:complete
MSRASSGFFWRSSKIKYLRWLILALSSVLLLAGLAFSLLLALSARPDLYANYQQGSAYFGSSGELLSLRLAPDQRYRLKLPLTEIAPVVQQATLLYEDRRFYQHFGLDIAAVGRAFWQGVVRKGRRQGASTLSMQLARLRFGLNTSNIAGKLRQLGYALYLERHFSKNELLEAYFNYAPYGGNIEGIAAASLIYFGKEARALTLPEALALSVIPQNPNQRSPLSTAGQQQLELARQRLSAIWQQAQQLPQLPHSSQYISKPRLPLDLPLRYLNRDSIPQQAPHFINQLRAQGQQQGRFYTSLQLPLQQRFEQQLNQYLKRQQTKGINNASALLIKRSTMQVQAWLGSADFNNEAIAGQVDGVSAARSPGSALKPFVYALALQQGLIHPKSLLTDLPRRYGSFNPENFDRQFVGPLPATMALINSRNLPAVQLQAQLQQPDFYQWLHTAGVPLDHPASHYGLALVLGGMELSMAQLVQLYAMLGNGGHWQTIAWQQQPAPARKPQPLLSAEAAFLTLDMLRQHPKVQSQLLSELTAQTAVAWKTGTSYAFRDAWAIALSGDYVLAVWLGNFDGSSNPNLIGRTAAGPLLFELLALLPQDTSQNQQLFTPAASLNLKKVELCSRSGDLPNKYCPQTEPGWFIPGVSPIKVSAIHRAVPIDINSGLRACVHQPGITQLKVFEFWPSEISKAMQQSGIIMAQPPRYQQHCAGRQMLSQQAPQIRSPQARLNYVIGQHAGQQIDTEEKQTSSLSQITLQASFDGAVTRAHWFANNRYLGAVAPGETLFWQGQSGQVQLTVVDDLGGAASVTIHVIDAPLLTAVSQQVSGE